MGILEQITAPVAEQVAQHGTGIVVAAGVAAFFVLSVVLNVLSQLLFKNPNEPPVVFHWIPIIGSTITYGIDPYKFFFECKAKVCWALTNIIGVCADRRNSTATATLSFYLERRLRYTLGEQAMSSFSMGSTRTSTPRKSTPC
jgi:hypothetical protein